MYEQAAEAAPGMTINQKLTEIGKQLEQANGKAQAAINTIIKLPDLKKIKFSGLGWPSQSENNPADVQVSFAPSGAGYSNCRLLIYPGRNDQSGYNKLGFWYLEGNALPTLEISIPCYGFRADQEKITQGMFEYQSGAKVRKARKIKNFRQDLDLNAKLYELAAEFAA